MRNTRLTVKKEHVAGTMYEMLILETIETSFVKVYTSTLQNRDTDLVLLSLPCHVASQGPMFHDAHVSIAITQRGYLYLVQHMYIYIIYTYIFLESIR